MTYEDKTLKCRDCGESFVFTARDQEFFAQKGFTNAPTRCKNCRVKKKEKAVAAAERPVFTITCKKCGKTTEMATEPRLPNDVFCANCFYETWEKNNGGSDQKATASAQSEESEA